MAFYKLKVRDLIIIALGAAFIAFPYFLMFHASTASMLQSALSQRFNSIFGKGVDKGLAENLLGHGENFLNVTLDQESEAPGPAETSLDELDKVLMKAAMPNKTLIITTLNAAWAEKNSMVDLFLDSFHRGLGTIHLLDHLLIVTLDQTSYQRCVRIHHHCYRLETEGVDFAGEKFFMSADYLKMMWRRISFLGTVLEKGYSLLFSDADIMWYRDPFTRFSPDADMQIACDRFNGNPTDLANFPNGGFVFVRSNLVTIEFYKFWYASRLRHPGKHDQDVLNDIKGSSEFHRIGVKLEFLDTVYFGGFCEVSQDFEKVCTMHANCCTGLPRKLHDLRLIMDDWNRFKSMTPAEKRANRVFWQAPKDCLRSCKKKRKIAYQVLVSLFILCCLAFCWCICHRPTWMPDTVFTRS